MNTHNKLNNISTRTSNADNKSKGKLKQNANDESQNIFTARINYEDGIVKKLYSNISNISEYFQSNKNTDDSDDSEYKQDIFEERVKFDDENKHAIDLGLSRITKVIKQEDEEADLGGVVDDVSYNLNILKDRSNTDIGKDYFLKSIFSKKIKNSSVTNKRAHEKNTLNKKDNDIAYGWIGPLAGFAVIALVLLVSIFIIFPQHAIENEINETAELIITEKNINNSDATLLDKTEFNEIVKNDIIPKRVVIDEGVKDNTVIENKFIEENNIDEDVAISENVVKVRIDEEVALNEIVEDKKINSSLQNADKVINESKPILNSSPTEVHSEVYSLLNTAKLQFNAKKLTTPSGDNAYETYQYILFKYPKNVDAINGIRDIHARYMQWANNYLQRDDKTRAERYLSRALIVDPNNQETIRALDKLAASNVLTSTKNSYITLTKNVPAEVQVELNQANKKLLKVEESIAANKRDYKIFLDAQLSYQKILKSYPGTDAAIVALLMIKNYYVEWANIESLNRNENTSAFLYKQANTINVSRSDLKHDVEILQVMSYKEN